MIRSMIARAGLCAALLAFGAGARAAPPSPVPDSAAAVPATATGCALKLGDYGDLPPATVLRVQDALAWFGLYANRIDRVVGRETREGLSNYCSRRHLRLAVEPASRKALIDELLRDSAVDRVYADWRGIIGSARFKAWSNTQPDRASLPVQSAQGTPAEIIDIIARFLKPSSGATRPAAGYRSDDDSSISYSLSADDLKALATRSEMLAKLAPMKDGGFLERDQFLARIGECLKDNAPGFQELILQNAERMARFTIGAQGILRLRAAGVPEDLLTMLDELPGYPTRAELEQGLRTLLAMPAAGTSSARPVERPAAGEAAEPAPPSVPSADPAPAAKADAAAGKWLPVILAQVEEAVAYRLSDAAWARLMAAVGKIPPFVPPMLQNLQGVDFPTRTLFKAAARARITGELAAQQPDRIDDQDLKRMESLGVPGQKLVALKEKVFASSAELVAAVDLALTESPTLPDILDSLAAQARKKHALDGGKGMRLARVADCKCLPPNMGMTYGFYPFWLDGEAPTVDFAKLGRIGYYALDFDDQGNVRLPKGWSETSAAALRTANQFRTKIDLVLGRSDWSAWQALGSKAREDAFANLAANLGALLQSDDALGDLQRQFGLAQTGKFDGVTLFFQYYPEDQESVDLFEKFVSRLRETLDGRRGFLNLMLSQDALGRGIFGYQSLLRWAKIYGGLEKQDDVTPTMFFLVLLEAPSTEKKKMLQNRIENNSRGRDRYILQRMTLPVVVVQPATTAGQPLLPNRQNLKDDVIYMQLNFGGIGFWPLPSMESTREVFPLLKEEFYPLQTNQTSTVCGIVCPNRWAFRLGFGFFLLLAAGSLAAYLACCGCRERLRRHFILVLAATVLPAFVLGMSLLYCDPDLLALSEGNSLLFLLVVAIIVYAVWNNREQKRIIP